MLANQKTINLYKRIADSNKERVFKHWHASSIGECPKAHYMKRKGVQSLQNPTGAKVIRWAGGHALEEAIRPHIEREYGGVGSNSRMTSKKLNLTGEFDNYSTKVKRLIEIKSVHDIAFVEKGGIVGLKESDGVWGAGRWEGKNKWKLKQTPYLHHEMQQYCYYKLMQELNLEVKGIDYVYISLGGRLAVYSMDVDLQSTPAVMVDRRLDELNKCWLEDKVPECICKKDGEDNIDHPLWKSTMQYCDFRTETGCCNYNSENNNQGEE